MSLHRWLPSSYSNYYHLNVYLPHPATHPKPVLARITNLSLNVYKYKLRGQTPLLPTLSLYRVVTLVGNLGNSWEFDLDHSQPGIGSEFVTFVQSGWESTKICLGQENDQRNNLDILEKKWNSWTFCI